MTTTIDQLTRRDDCFPLVRLFRVRPAHEFDHTTQAPLVSRGPNSSVALSHCVNETAHVVAIDDHGGSWWKW